MIMDIAVASSCMLSLPYLAKLLCFSQSTIYMIYKAGWETHEQWLSLAQR